MDNFFDKNNTNPKKLDMRGVFLVLTLKKIHIWIGSKVSPLMKDLYLKAAKDYIKLLQENEKASTLIQEEVEGTESKEFLAIWSGKISKNNISYINH